jgi:hypothetical protein
LSRKLILTWFLLCVIAASGFFVACYNQHPRTKENASGVEHQFAGLPDLTADGPHNYNAEIAKIEARRLTLASRYAQASASEKAEIISQARVLVTRSIYTEILPYWYGTPWDFSGTTEVPGEGKIACGYFVSTVLRDAGWKVQRSRLAQQASENIILSLTSDPNVRRFRRVGIGDFVSAVKEWGTGLYVVGLDVHVGFIANTGDEVYFVHSSYIQPYAVVRERALESKVLAASNYRVLGKVTADDRFIEKWLLRTEIVTRGT